MNSLPIVRIKFKKVHLVGFIIQYKENTRFRVYCISIHNQIMKTYLGITGKSNSAFRITKAAKFYNIKYNDIPRVTTRKNNMADEL